MIRSNWLMFLILLLLCACGAAKEKEEEKIETDVQMLRRFINLDSLSPTSVKWVHGSPTGKPDRLGIGPTDFYVIAVITLSEKDFYTVKEQYKSREDIREKVHLGKDFVRDWFSETVKGCLEAEGDYLRINVPVYDGATFIKSYTHGICFFTKNNEVLIQVST